jgi:hypothetical protein
LVADLVLQDAGGHQGLLEVIVVGFLLIICLFIARLEFGRIEEVVLQLVDLDEDHVA